MKKLIALYKTPDDEAAFMAHYTSVHVPLVEKIPGLRKVEITKIGKTLMGDKGFFLMAEMYFDDEDFSAAMASAENAATGKDLANFAQGLATVMIADVL